ncbi:MAG: transglycosylase SLT domain-containing protein [Fusobacteriaceae bacterium]
MKKILILFFYIIITSFSFSYYIGDYLLFNEAKILFEKGDYKNADLKFITLEKNFSSSNIVKSNYYTFFYALNLEKLKDYDRAISYMEKAVYSPRALNGKNYFFLKRNYFLAAFHLKNNNLEEARPYLISLLIEDLSSLENIYEGFTFKNLLNEDIRFQILFDIKNKNDFSKLYYFSDLELIKIGEFFLNSKNYNSAKQLFQYLYDKNKKDPEISSFYLKSLYFSHNNNELLEVSNKILRNLNIPEVYYYRGKIFAQKKDYNRSIYNLKQVLLLFSNYKDNLYVLDARESLLNIYFSLDSYEEIISISKNIKSPTKNEQMIIIDTYFKLKKYDEGLTESINFIKKYPFSYQSNRLFLLLNSLNLDKDKEHELFEKINLFSAIPSIKLTGEMVTTILNNAKYYKLDLDKINKNPEFKKLYNIAKLKDSNLLELEIENTKLLSKNRTIKKILLTQILEAGEFYHLAYLNSTKFNSNLYKYRNFISLLYPKYYKELVSKASVTYNIPESIIFTIINYSSKFDSRKISETNRYGLMQLHNKSNNLKNTDLMLTPEYNIQLGTAELQILLKKNNNNKIATLIEYIYGKKIKDSIYFENDDFYLDRISDGKLKEELSTLLLTYLFYKALY